MLEWVPSKMPTALRATLSHRIASYAVAITLSLAGCGGMVAGSPDGGSGCPSASDIQTQAAVGTACASDGLFCPEPDCDPCSQNCRAVECTQGVWEPAANTGICTMDSGHCVVIDLKSFDQSCNVDSDCMAVTSGTFCSGQAFCVCPTAAINVDGQSQYEADVQLLQSLGPSMCGCPLFGTPRCFAHQCTICGGGQPCPDGG